MISSSLRGQHRGNDKHHLARPNDCMVFPLCEWGEMRVDQ